MKKVILIILIAIINLNADSHYNKGRELYLQGKYFNALKEFYISARRHNSNAYMELGLMYEKGIGTNKNGMMALYWYEKAKQRGNSYAKNRLTPSFIKELQSSDIKENTDDINY